MTYKEWLSQWLELYVKPLKHRTHERYKDICNLHIRGGLGDYEMDELTPLVLQKHVNELIAHGNHKTGGELSANSVLVSYPFTPCGIPLQQEHLKAVWTLKRYPRY